MLLKTSFLVFRFSCNADFELIQPLQFQNKTNIETIGFYLMHFAFALDLWNVDLLDIGVDLLVSHG